MNRVHGFDKQRCPIGTLRLHGIGPRVAARRSRGLRATRSDLGLPFTWEKYGETSKMLEWHIMAQILIHIYLQQKVDVC